jgi:hypothetical protein
MRFSDPITYRLIEKTVGVLFYLRLLGIASIALLCRYYRVPGLAILAIIVIVVGINFIAWLRGNWAGEKDECPSMPGTVVPELGEPIMFVQSETIIAGKVFSADAVGNFFSIELPGGKVSDWIRCEDPRWSRGSEGMAIGIWQDVYYNHRGCKPIERFTEPGL